MAKLIAIEWDGREARVAVASARGNEALVEQAFAINLDLPSSDDESSSVAIGPLVAEALTARGLNGADALVALGRSNIELRVLSLPPVPPEELPELVRFQALQAFTAIGEDWPLDFVELDAHEDSISVLAAVVSPNQIGQVQDICAASELKPQCLVLRPFAATSLLARSGVIDSTRNCLVVDLLADDADLTAISNGQVVFMRTIRLPAQQDPAVQSRALVGEIRRTIGAAQNQMGGSSIDQIVICGSETDHDALHEAVSATLSLDVVSFDPFQAVRLSRSLRNELPSNSGRFAPLLGMLASEIAGTGHALDFLNPRKRPAPPSNTRRNALIGTGAVAVVAILALGLLFKQNQLNDRIAELKEKEASMIKTGDVAKELVKNAAVIKTFNDGDITWLDELREVARRLPDADHAILDEVTVTAGVGGGGTMILKGNVKTSDVIFGLEESLRYDNNIVKGKYGNIDRNQPDYPYTLDTTIIVPPDVHDNGHSKGRPYRDEVRKEAATAPKTTGGDASQPEAKSETETAKPPEARTEEATSPKTTDGDASQPEAKPETETAKPPEARTEEATSPKTTGGDASQPEAKPKTETAEPSEPSGSDTP